MFELIILNADGTRYWTEHFNSMEGLNKWLEEEKTRPYWKKELATQIVDHTPAPFVPSDEEIARQAQVATIKQRLKTLAGQSDMTAAEVKETIMKLMKVKLLQGEV